MNTPLRVEQILAIAEDYSNEFGLEAKHTVAFARDIETAVRAQRGVPDGCTVKKEIEYLTSSRKHVPQVTISFPPVDYEDATNPLWEARDALAAALSAAPTAPQAAAQAEPDVWFEDNNGAARKTPEGCQSFGAGGVPYAVWVGNQRYLKEPSPQQADAQPSQAAKTLNAKIADQLRPFLKPGDKVIWRDSFRWKDDDGVLSNHYDSLELKHLAEDFGYEIDWDTNMHHAAIVRAAASNGKGERE